MIDIVSLYFKAGKGGDGRISFLQSRYQPKGGPDGGDGGRGGSIVLRGNRNINTLKDFAGKRTIEAKSGQMGGKDKSTGSDSDDVILDVPVGTVVWRAQNFIRKTEQKMYSYTEEEGRKEWIIGLHRRVKVNLVELIPKDAKKKKVIRKTIKLGHNEAVYELVGELIEDGEQIVVAKGGKGGRGNWRFRSSTHTTPKEAEAGQDGQEGQIVLELQMLADIGLIGYPNVGKSTLLSVLTNAKPTIADYPFTTLEPNLGVIEFTRDGKEKQNYLIADIPGVIEGASHGKGLGLQFLRHIERCRLFLFVLGPTSSSIEEPDSKKIAQSLIEQYQTLENELTLYEQQILDAGENLEVSLTDKRRFIVLSKSDLLDERQREEVLKLLSQKLGINVQSISSKTMKNVDDLRDKIQEMVASN